MLYPGLAICWRQSIIHNILCFINPWAEDCDACPSRLGPKRQDGELQAELRIRGKAAVGRASALIAVVIGRGSHTRINDDVTGYAPSYWPVIGRLRPWVGSQHWGESLKGQRRPKRSREERGQRHPWTWRLPYPCYKHR